MDRKQIRWNGWGWAAHKDEIAAREEVWSWLAAELGMPSLLATPARALEDIPLAPSRLTSEQRARLSDVVGQERMREDAYERAFHALGDSYHDLLRLRAGDLSTAPDAVAYPTGSDEVLSILQYASEQNIAVVPFGGGSSVVGAVSGTPRAFRCAITLDLSRMDRLLDVDLTAGTATAETGIYGPALEKMLGAKGVTLGHFPQSFEFSTLGGWIAHRGAGQSSHGYGRAEDWLIAVKLATPRGVLATEDFPPNSVGPDLNDIVLGSEGVFGVITQATFRIKTSPKVRDYRGWLFPDFEQGTAAIRAAADLPVTMLRLSDAGETRFYRAFGSIGSKPGLLRNLQSAYLQRRGFGAKMCALIAGFEGEAMMVERSRQQFTKIARQFGALAIGKGQGERWLQGRFHGPYSRDPMMDRGIGVDTLETAASWAKLPGLYAAVKTALEDAIVKSAPRPGAHGIVMCHISHFYPHGASLYFTCIFPRHLDNDLAQWRTIKTAATDAIVANGGTVSHHHGVGEDHLPWMQREKGALGIEILRAIKRTLDPKGVMNPGKLIPE